MGTRKARVEKCIKYANRTSPRVFKAKDVARIARYARDDGSVSEEIAARVMVALGFGRYFCAVVDSLNALNVVLVTVTKVAGATALLKVLDFFIDLLSRGQYRKIPKINLIGLALVIVVSSLEAILKAVREILSNFDVVIAALVSMRKICELIDLIEKEV